MKKESIKISEVIAAKNFHNVKSAHVMRITWEGGSQDLYMREELLDGQVTWKIFNKGMYDEQSDANAISLEKKFRKSFVQK